MSRARAGLAALALLTGVACGAVPGGGTDVATTTGPGADTLAAVPEDAWTGRVTRISDGDTIWVTVLDEVAGLRRGDDVKLRLLRIDTPEIAHDPEPAECFGPEATQAITALAPLGSEVRLAFDVEREDRFGRLLVHVWNDRGVWVNGELLRQGMAEAITVRPNDGYDDLPYDIEEDARRAGRGLWGACPD